MAIQIWVKTPFIRTNRPSNTCLKIAECKLYYLSTLCIFTLWTFLQDSMQLVCCLYVKKLRVKDTRFIVNRFNPNETASSFFTFSHSLLILIHKLPTVVNILFPLCHRSRTNITFSFFDRTSRSLFCRNKCRLNWRPAPLLYWASVQYFAVYYSYRYYGVKYRILTSRLLRKFANSMYGNLNIQLISDLVAFNSIS